MGEGLLGSGVATSAPSILAPSNEVAAVLAAALFSAPIAGELSAEEAPGLLVSVAGSCMAFGHREIEKQTGALFHQHSVYTWTLDTAFG